MGLLSANFKNLFFDRQAVTRGLSQAARKVLSKFGAFVRQRAKTSIKKRKKISQPGSPPSSHEGSLRKLIFFGYDTNRHSVVIGPVKFKKGEAPSLLEFGGERTYRRKSGKVERQQYQPRPFMGPAFRAELGDAADLWKDSITK